MKNTLAIHRILKGTFWSIVYTIFILWALKLLWEVLVDLKMRRRWKDWKINRRIMKARKLEAYLGGYDDGTGPPWEE